MPERLLCQACGGNGVIRLPKGVSECLTCHGDGWAPIDVDSVIAAERERLAKMIEQYASEQAHGRARLILSIAAKDVRRGRRLTDAERVANLRAAIAEDDSELANRIFGTRP